MDIADDDKEQLLAGLKCHPHLIVEELELALLKPAAPIRRSPSSEAPEALESVQIFEMSVEGRLTCAQCDATFAKKKFGLKRHLSAHCDERPYMCAICGDGFARSDLLAKHCRRINDVYESRPEAQEPEEEEPQSEQMRTRESANRGTHSEIVKGTRVQVDQQGKRALECWNGKTLGQRLRDGLVPQRQFTWISATYEKQSAGQHISWSPKSNPCAIVRENMAWVNSVPQGGHLFILIRSTSGVSLDRRSFCDFVKVLSEKLTEFTLVLSAVILATYMRHRRGHPSPGLRLTMTLSKAELQSFFLEKKGNGDLDLFVRMLEHESNLRVDERKWLSARKAVPQEDQDYAEWVDHGDMA
ncbi:hypothetical protein IWX91DRAFT_409088 [Phyllosticta citricarpa]